MKTTIITTIAAMMMMIVLLLVLEFVDIEDVGFTDDVVPVFESKTLNSVEKLENSLLNPLKSLEKLENGLAVILDTSSFCIDPDDKQDYTNDNRKYDKPIFREKS
jgi:hypothetical protein